MNGPVMIGVLFSTGVAHTNTSRKSVASPFFDSAVATTALWRQSYKRNIVSKRQKD